jgi:hypothetical protein
VGKEWCEFLKKEKKGRKKQCKEMRKKERLERVIKKESQTQGKQRKLGR